MKMLTEEKLRSIIREAFTQGCQYVAKCHLEGNLPEDIEIKTHLDEVADHLISEADRA